MPTENIRVLHVIARLNVGGTAKYLSNLLPSLEKNGVEVLLAVGHVQNEEVEDSVLQVLKFQRIESLGRKFSPISDLRAYRELRRCIRCFRPDVIHSHTFKAGFLARLQFPRIPKVHTYHGHLLTDPEFSRFQLKAIVMLERILAKFTRTLLVTGDQVAKDLLVSKIGRKEQYLSIPGELGFMQLLPRGTARKQLNLKDSFSVIWLARMAPVKQPKVMVEVARLCPEFTFLMCGDGSELEFIKSIAPKNMLVLGMVEPANLLSAADVFVSTSANEGIPYSLLEAQAAGLPIVAVDAGAISEIVEHGVSGFLTNGEPIEIASRILKLEKNDLLRRKMGTAGLANSRGKSSKPESATLHQQIYQRLTD